MTDPAARGPLVTLLTDYGTTDLYAGAVKGAILSVAPGTTIVDLTHEVPRHDVEAGAFLLKTAWRVFPPGTIHVAVVDPGVGGERLPIGLRARGAIFVGPDNGLFSWIAREAPVEECRALTNPRFRREPVSATFHGRDVFAPAAGWLARGTPLREFGESVRPRMLDLPAPAISQRGILAHVVHVDRFGNCLLDVTRSDMERALGALPATLRAAAPGRSVEGLRATYEGAPAGTVFFLVGSSGHLEIASDRDSASRLTGLRRGDPIEITL